MAVDAQVSGTAVGSAQNSSHASPLDVGKN